MSDFSEPTPHNELVELAETERTRRTSINFAGKILILYKLFHLSISNKIRIY
jgi:hypothetical protein